MLDLKTTSDGIILKIYIQPKAAKNEISGIHDDALKIRLTAPPIENAANKMCIKFLSKQLSIPKSRLEIISGHTNRNKQVLIRHPENTLPEKSAQKIKQQIANLVG